MFNECSLAEEAANIDAMADMRWNLQRQRSFTMDNKSPALQPLIPDGKPSFQRQMSSSARLESKVRTSCHCHRWLASCYWSCLLLVNDYTRSACIMNVRGVSRILINGCYQGSINSGLSGVKV